MKLINKTLLFTFLIIGAFLRAEEGPPSPPPGGGGGTGPGTPASPIDMYIYALLVVGFILIVYFAKKKQKNIA